MNIQIIQIKKNPRTRGTLFFCVDGKLKLTKASKQKRIQ